MFLKLIQHTYFLAYYKGAKNSKGKRSDISDAALYYINFIFILILLILLFASKLLFKVNIDTDRKTLIIFSIIIISTFFIFTYKNICTPKKHYKIIKFYLSDFYLKRTISYIPLIISFVLPIISLVSLVILYVNKYGKH
jgi:hypothetical protein